MMDETTQPSGSDLEALIQACLEKLLPTPEWKVPKGYPDSLALCIIDAIWSNNNRYPIVHGVIERYRSRRRRWSNADKDGVPELLQFYETVGGVAAFIDQVGTRNRLSNQLDSPQKGEAVRLIANAFQDLGVNTAAQFRQIDGTELGDQLKSMWVTIPHQSSEVSWHYLRALVGLPDVIPDHAVVRFIADALGIDETDIDPDRAIALVQAAARHFGVDQRALDHEIWEYQSGKRSFHDQFYEKEQLAEAAASFLGVAFPALDRLHVIPTPRYHPYINVGRDYTGGDVSGPEREALEEILLTQYPQRFGKPMTRSDPEFPHFYTFSLLEGAIVRIGLADEQYEANTTAVRDSIDELIQVLDSCSYRLICCRAMSHLTTSGEPVTIGDITVYPEDSTQSLLRRTRELIPAAPSAFNRERPFFYDPPHSLIVVSKETTQPDPYKIMSELARSVDRFLLVARLLFAGTHQSGWQVTGATTLVSRIDPVYERCPTPGMPNLLIQRIIRLEPEHEYAFIALDDVLTAADVNREKMFTTSFDIALYNFNRAYEEGDHYERIIDLATALEAILTGSDGNSEEIGLRLRNRAAALLWTENDSASTIFNDVKNLYNLRSKLIHGAKIKESDLLKWLRSVSTVPNDAPFGVAFAFAVDRLRDIVRRCFLARLCLASGDKPIWPFEHQVFVDSTLADDADRATWRKAWRDMLASLGVADAANPAIRGVDPIESGSSQRSVTSRNDT